MTLRECGHSLGNFWLMPKKWGIVGQVRRIVASSRDATFRIGMARMDWAAMSGGPRCNATTSKVVEDARLLLADSLIV